MFFKIVKFRPTIVPVSIDFYLIVVFFIIAEFPLSIEVCTKIERYIGNFALLHLRQKSNSSKYKNIFHQKDQF